MTTGTNRISPWLTAAIVTVGVLAAAVVTLVQYMNAIPPLHPDPAKVPSVTGVLPSPQWAAVVEKARQLARAEIGSQNLPGLSVAVGAGGNLVWSEGFGWADIESHLPVAPGLRFRIGHVSKALTSAAVGLLREQGRLHLDDEIQKYVPDFPRKEWPVTLRQLMGNVAGVRHYRGEEADVPEGHCARASEGLQSFANEPLLFEPGTEYRYSTYGWVLASAAVEAVAGEPFFSFMQTQIFTPLGMTETTADSGKASGPGQATFYFPRFSGDNDFGHDVAGDADYSCFAGAGGFQSTPTDLVRFGLAMMSGKFLRPDTVTLLQTRQTLASEKETDYGLGWMLETIPLAGESTRLAGHASRSLLAAATSFLTFPDRGLVVAVTSNTSYAGTRAIALGIAQAFAEGRTGTH